MLRNAVVSTSVYPAVLFQFFFALERSRMGHEGPDSGAELEVEIRDAYPFRWGQRSDRPSR